MKKMSIITTLMLISAGCNFNAPEDKIQLAKNEKPTPKMLTFSTKAEKHSSNIKDNLPKIKYINLIFKTEKLPRNSKYSVRIPENGAYKVIFQSGTKFQITDNDATDGQATIQMPTVPMDGFVRVLKPKRNKQGGKLSLEDKLYFLNEEITYLKKDKNERDFDESEDDDEMNEDRFESDKDGFCKERESKRKWFNIGKRIFPIPSEWHNDDGNNYVLNFNNDGIKNFVMRWNKTDKPDFPMNINEITPEAGGTIDFKGVGKIEIPPGAVDKNTIVTMKQELSAPEVLFFEPDVIEGRYKDFVSPLVRIEPFGLDLKKHGKIYLETDKQRIGNNHPSQMEWFMGKNKINWILMDFERPTVFSNRDMDYSAPLPSFWYYSKQFPAYVKPDAGVEPDDRPLKYEPLNYNTQNFQAKSSNIIDDCAKNYSQYSSKFKIYNNNNTSTDKIDNIKRRLGTSLCHFKTLSGFEPYTWNEYENKIPIELPPVLKPQGKAEPYFLNEKLDSNYEGVTNKAKILLKDDKAVEHELWHAFQLRKDGSKSVVENAWISESSATHMGASAFKLYKKSSDSDYDIDKPGEYANEGILDISLLSIPEINTFKSSLYVPTNDDNTKSRKYHSRSAFFTYLAHPDTKLGGDKVIINVLNNVPSNLHLNKFHDFSIHSFKNDRFDIYKLDTVEIGENYLNEQNNILVSNKLLEIKPTHPLPNLSMEFQKILPVEGNNLKATLIVNNIKPQNTKCQNSLEISYLGLNEDKVEEEKKLNFGKNTISGFGKDFSSILLVISNSNKVLEGDSCSYDIKVGYLCGDAKRPSLLPYGTASISGCR